MLNDPAVSHDVMEGKSAYNRYAKLPAGGAALALPLLEKAVRCVALDTSDQSIVFLAFNPVAQKTTHASVLQASPQAAPDRRRSGSPLNTPRVTASGATFTRFSFSLISYVHELRVDRVRFLNLEWLAAWGQCGDPQPSVPESREKRKPRLAIGALLFRS
jgi:hypothetical protein